MTTAETPVHAYADSIARVALLDPGEKLPIIYEDNTWCVVSLRGASGWIMKTPQDTAASFWFTPDVLKTITAAALGCQYNGQSYEATLNDAGKLAELSALLSVAEDQGGPMAGCPFGLITLTLLTLHGPVYRVDGARDYAYSEQEGEDVPEPSKEDIFRIFGMDNPFPY